MVLVALRAALWVAPWAAPRAALRASTGLAPVVVPEFAAVAALKDTMECSVRGSVRFYLWDALEGADRTWGSSSPEVGLRWNENRDLVITNTIHGKFSFVRRGGRSSILSRMTLH